jgi:hypothetical protein
LLLPEVKVVPHLAKPKPGLVLSKLLPVLIPLVRWMLHLAILILLARLIPQVKVVPYLAKPILGLCLSKLPLLLLLLARLMPYPYLSRMMLHPAMLTPFLLTMPTMVLLLMILATCAVRCAARKHHES